MTTNPDDDLEGILDRPAPMSESYIAEAFDPRWVCACGQTFVTDAGYGRHVVDCHTCQP